MGLTIHLQQQLTGLDNEESCWRLKKHGLTNREIARELGIAPVSVHRCLKRALKRAQDELRSSVVSDVVIAKERLEGLYRAALDAYHASIGERVRRRSKRRDGGEAGAVTETQIDTEARIGDPRFLAEAYKAVDGIRKLCGLDAPTRMQVVDPERPFESLPADALAAELRAELKKYGIDAQTLTGDPPADGERTH